MVTGMMHQWHVKVSLRTMSCATTLFESETGNPYFITACLRHWSGCRILMSNTRNGVHYQANSVEVEGCRIGTMGPV